MNSAALSESNADRTAATAVVAASNEVIPIRAVV